MGSPWCGCMVRWLDGTDEFVVLKAKALEALSAYLEVRKGVPEASAVFVAVGGRGVDA